MRHLQHNKECIYCKKQYIATRIDSKYCSGICKAADNRKQKINTEVKMGGGQRSAELEIVKKPEEVRKPEEKVIQNPVMLQNTVPIVNKIKPNAPIGTITPIVKQPEITDYDKPVITEPTEPPLIKKHIPPQMKLPEIENTEHPHKETEKRKKFGFRQRHFSLVKG